MLVEILGVFIVTSVLLFLVLTLGLVETLLAFVITGILMFLASILGAETED